MDIIQVVLPPWNPYCIGCYALVNMATEQLLRTGAPGETLVFPSDCAVDLGAPYYASAHQRYACGFRRGPGGYTLCTVIRRPSGLTWACAKRYRLLPGKHEASRRNGRRLRIIQWVDCFLFARVVGIRFVLPTLLALHLQQGTDPPSGQLLPFRCVRMTTFLKVWPQRSQCHPFSRLSC